MSLAPQIISAAPGTPAGTVQTIADIQRTINALTAEAGNLHPRSISADRIEVNAITANEIAADTITTTEIKVGTVTGGPGGDIAGTTITGSNIVTGTITATQIASDTIIAGNIQAGAVTGAGTGGTGEVAPATITGFNIEAGTVNADRITAGTITADRLVATNLGAIFADLGTVTSGTLSVGAGACVISDALGIVIVQGATAPHNITWLTGGAATAAVISSQTSGTNSYLDLVSNAPSGGATVDLGMNATTLGINSNANLLVNGNHWIFDGAGRTQMPGGFWLYGAGTALTTRPATPAATSAAIIALLQQYNMCA